MGLVCKVRHVPINFDWMKDAREFETLGPLSVCWVFIVKHVIV
jgi:hypothetical protein